MVTASDGRDALSAVLNQIPPTMEATRAFLGKTVSLGSVTDESGNVDLHKQQEVINGVIAAALVSIVLLENRVEVLEGRPGVSTDALTAVFSEFRFGTGGK